MAQKSKTFPKSDLAGAARRFDSSGGPRNAWTQGRATEEETDMSEMIVWIVGVFGATVAFQTACLVGLSIYLVRLIVAAKEGPGK